MEEPSFIRKYLLGDLEEGERERVELRLLSDGDFAEAVSGARQELFEEYAAGALDAPERSSFERHCLNTHGAPKRLKFARALNRSVDSRLKELEAAARPVAGLRQRLWQFLTGSWPRVAIPLAALLLVVSYATWQMSQRRAAGDDGGPRAALAQRILSLNTPGGDGATGAVHSVTLRGDIVRESQGLPRVSAPAAAGVLELRLVLEGEPYTSYSAALLTDEEAEVAAVGGLRGESQGGDTVLVFKLPAHALPRGDYQVRVEGVGGDGRARTVGRYPFRLHGP